ncbi:hypothetical protein M422DRAFT_274841 [Sphaerobolus stellatus SS14]|uniref:Uncharacterized protein n=1 Tax=Sphaerobolus stellatus (strain SS14) TaxID=990650 RepID=A0A0C9TR97_SPHS4|nr:hypothetical protein M422DRAFT_274841 [Sphaerobolus stellatus SS14]
MGPDYFTTSDYSSTDVIDRNGLKALHTHLESRVARSPAETTSLLQNFYSVIPVLHKSFPLDSDKVLLGGVYAWYLPCPTCQRCSVPYHFTSSSKDVKLVAGFASNDHNVGDWKLSTVSSEVWSSLKQSDKGIQLSFTESQTTENAYTRGDRNQSEHDSENENAVLVRLFSYNNIPRPIPILYAPVRIVGVSFEGFTGGRKDIRLITRFYFEKTSGSVTPYDGGVLGDRAVVMQRRLLPRGSFVGESKNEDCVDFTLHCQCMSAERAWGWVCGGNGSGCTEDRNKCSGYNQVTWIGEEENVPSTMIAPKENPTLFTPPSAVRIDSPELDKAIVNANSFANPSEKRTTNTTRKHHTSLTSSKRKNGHKMTHISRTSSQLTSCQYRRRP